MNVKSIELFFELLRVVTNAKTTLSRAYSEKEWEDAYNLAEQQTVLGVLLDALEKIQKDRADLMPTQTQLWKWIGMAQMVEQTTLKMEGAAKITIDYFHENGFACQVLKGSAVARYYPNPLRRSSGDIDIWLDGDREKIYDFARTFDKNRMLYGVNYHHIHFHLIDGIHIEVHIWPSFLSSPLRNYRLHQFCDLHRPTIEKSMPSLAFDRVFILLHCYRHMCGDGVGFRQVMDYFYVLKQGFTEEERMDAVYWIKKLGMERFSRGLMWVLQDAFGLEDKYLIIEPYEKEGRFIMNEILITGNMGHSDNRCWGSKETALSRFFFNLRRDFYLVGHYPHEAIWQPFFSIWLYSWRLFNGLLRDRAGYNVERKYVKVK